MVLFQIGFQFKDVQFVVRDGDKADTAHFVFCFLAPGDVNRRAGGIAWVGIGIIPVDFGVEAGAFGEGLELLEKVAVLPGEIPIGDVKKRLDAAIGERGGHFDFGGEVMGMGAHADSVDGDGERVGVADDEVLIAGGNIEAREEGISGRHLNACQRAAGGLFGKVEGDLGFFSFGFAGGMEMVLDNEVGVFGEAQRESAGVEMRLTADRPSA